MKKKRKIKVSRKGAKYAKKKPVLKNIKHKGKKNRKEQHSQMNLPSGKASANKTRGMKLAHKVSILKKEQKTNTVSVVILAAGIGKRMKSDLPKVLHPICGKPMLWYVTDNARQTIASLPDMNADKIVIVTGKDTSRFRSCVPGIPAEFVVQFPPLGTGDAVLKTEEILMSRKDGRVIILCGDVPALRVETLRQLLIYHCSKKAAATILTAVLPDAGSYGRIIRKGEKVLKIVEAVDANEKEKHVREINSGIYIFEKSKLFAALHKVKPLNAQMEYYLTDTIEIMQKKGLNIYAYAAPDWHEIMGINTRKELWERESMIQARIIEKAQLDGVTIRNPNNTRIDWDVYIGKDSVIESGAELLGRTYIGEKCIIGQNVKIINSKISSGSEIGEGSTIEDAELL